MILFIQSSCDVAMKNRPMHIHRTVKICNSLLQAQQCDTISLPNILYHISLHLRNLLV